MSVAKEKLNKYMEAQKKKKRTQGDVAADFGCSRSYLSELLSGVKLTPSISLAKKIQEVTKIVKVGDWAKNDN